MVRDSEKSAAMPQTTLLPGQALTIFMTNLGVISDDPLFIFSYPSDLSSLTFASMVF